MRWWMFDIANWFFLMALGTGLTDLFLNYRWRKLKKRRGLFVVALFLSLVWLGVFYGSFVEPRMLVIKRETIEVFDNSNLSIKAAVLSDVHVGPYKRAGWVEKVVAKTNAENPDIIFLLGDYIMGVEGKTEDLSGLGQLKAPLGVFAILGNHDYQNNRQDEIETALKNFGITVLHNSSTEITLSDSSVLSLTGIGDIWNDSDIEKTLAGFSQEQQVILLAHNPDAILDPAVKVTDLILSGHTHGGQISLPFFGAMFVPTTIGKYFDKGKFLVNNISLFITSGLGEMGPRARLFNPPEIVMLTID